jgi:hypothetical protein
VVLRGSTAAAQDVAEAALGELPEVLRRGLGALVVAAEGVRQAGVRVARRVHGRDAREDLEVGTHLGGAERAVHRR